MPALARPRRTPLAIRSAQVATAAALAAGCIAYAAGGPAADRAAAASAGSAESGGASLLARTGATARAAAAEAARAAESARVGDAARASRSVTRAARVAVSAPSASGPMSRSVGVLGVTAVVKPDPVKTFAAIAQTTPSGGARPATARAKAPAPAGGSTSAYAAAGAALGLVPSAIAVYSAIRSTFGITNIGGLRPGDWGDHGTGHAVDVMITSSGQGDAVAGYAIANAGRFNIKYVIWQQRIWMPSTGSWKLMADRGSPTQNHMDHVHISVN